MGEAAVQIVASNHHLHRALVARLSRYQGIRIVAETREGMLEIQRDAVVTPVKDCSPRHCAQLATAGLRVVILAPVPNAAEHERYLEAGAAAYLPMSFDLSELVEALLGCTLDGAG